MQVVGHVVLVVPQPSPAHHHDCCEICISGGVRIPGRRKSIVAAVIVRLRLGVQILRGNLDILQLELKPAGNVDEDGYEHHRNNVQESLEERKKRKTSKM